MNNFIYISSAEGGAQINLSQVKYIEYIDNKNKIRFIYNTNINTEVTITDNTYEKQKEYLISLGKTLDKEI